MTAAVCLNRIWGSARFKNQFVLLKLTRGFHCSEGRFCYQASNGRLGQENSLLQKFIHGKKVDFRLFHITCTNRDLMEFFDEKKNWEEREVKSGRSWKREELRLKSNSDLHKLWYVLLKEHNMLLTMEEEYKRLVEPFPNPERIDKVKESMHNLEEVVRERNKAYYELETGHDGERPTQLVEDVLGRHRFYKLREYPIPHEVNKAWQQNFLFNHWDPPHVIEFKKLMREKAIRAKKKDRSDNVMTVAGLLKRFPHVSDEALQEKYPDVDINRMRESWRLRHH